MPIIKHTHGNASVERSGTGPTTTWLIRLEGQTSESTQEMRIRNKKDIEDLKRVIGQVEHAAKVLGEEPADL